MYHVYGMTIEIIPPQVPATSATKTKRDHGNKKKDICRLRQLYTCTCTGNYNASFYTAERAGGKKRKRNGTCVCEWVDARDRRPPGFGDDMMDSDASENNETKTG